MTKKLTLTDDDWAALTLSRPVKIGKQTAEVEPLPFSAFGRVIRRIADLRGVFEHHGLSMAEAFSNPDQWPALAAVIADNAPDLLAECVPLDAADIDRLPGGKVVELVVAALEVNLEAQEGLEKNCRKLGELVERAAGTAGSVPPSNTSSKTATPGAISKATR